MTDREIFMNAPRGVAPELLEAYLDKMCGEDGDLRGRVEALMAADDAAGSFLDGPALEDAPTLQNEVAITEIEGYTIGNYKLLQRIGEGGFGVVYMADQLRPVKRRVAFKVIKLGMDTKEVVARFEAERQALAMMDHPNIAKVLDAGSTDTGRPFFVMELVKGVPITEFCDEKSLSTEARLELFVDVCRAVQHAHQKGIIHRDLKPSNVMVTMHDDKAVPKVIDFGVAKATQMELTEKTLYTRYEQFIGTPAYMSPEQAQLSGLDIDTRSDIYALGVLLYELLTGHTPFDSRELLSAGYDEIRRIIREDEPPKPSTRLGTMGDAALTELAKCRQSDPQRLRSLIRGDLDWIVMKALEKDRTRRYETSGAMVLDIQRHLASEPISAGAPSTLYRLRKYVRRNRSAVAVLSVVIGLLMVGVLVLLAFNTQLDGFNRQLEARERSTRVNLYASDMFAVSESIAAGNFVLARKLLEDHIPRKGEEDLRGFEWWHYLHASRGEQAQTLGGHEGVITGIASSTEGGLMVTTDASGLVQLWKRSGDRFAPFASVRVDNLRTNRGTFRFPEPAFSPDGKRLFLMTQESREARGQLVTGPQSGVVAYEVTSRGVGEIVNTYPNVSAYAASPSRPELALLSGSELKVVNYESGEEKRFDAEGINNLSFVGLDGNRLAFIEPSGDSVGILALHGDEPRQSRKVLSWGLRVAGDPTGKHVAVCLRNNQVELVSLDPSLPNRIIMLGDTGSTDGFVMDTAFSGDGRYLAACGPDLTIKVFETASGDLVQVFRGHGYPVQRLAFVPGGEVIVSGAGEGAAFVWEVGSRNSTDLVDGLRASFSPDGGSFLVREVGTQASLLRATQSGAVLGRKVEDEICLGYAPDGKSILYARRHSPLVPVERTQLAAGALGYEVQQLQALLIAAEGPIMSIDGDFGQRTSGALRRFQERAGVPVTGTSDEATWDALYAFHHDSYFDLIVWRDLAGRETGRSVQLDACPPFGDLYLAPGGRKIVGHFAGQAGGHLGMWDADSGKRVHWIRMGEKSSVPNRIEFSRDGRFVTACLVHPGQGGGVWELDSGEQVLTIRSQAEGNPDGHENAIFQIAISPDAKLAASASWDGTVRLWDMATGKVVGVLEGHTNDVYAVAFSPDGRTLASAGSDIRLWHVETGRPIGTLPNQLAPILNLDFSPDGSVLAAGSRNEPNRIQLFRAPRTNAGP